MSDPIPEGYEVRSYVVTPPSDAGTKRRTEAEVICGTFGEVSTWVNGNNRELVLRKLRWILKNSLRSVERAISHEVLVRKSKKKIGHTIKRHGRSWFECPRRL